MEELRKRIITGSMELFSKFGIKSCTMDDVSKDLGISKKTLYKFVANKSDLVEQGVKSTFEQVSSDLQGIAKTIDNAIDELYEIDKYFDEIMRQQHPAMMFQLGKYFPETYKWLQDAKAKFVTETTTNNLKKGISQQLYRESINIEYICYIYMAHTNLYLNEEGIPMDVCTSSDFHQHHLEYHVRGIASAKGLDYLNNKLKDN